MRCIIAAMPRRPHRLELYERAVQHPAAEASLLWRMYEDALPDRGPAFRGRLREDFAGTAALAAAWVEQDEDFRALAVERHGPTRRWAKRSVEQRLGDRAEDVVLVESDVMDLLGPRVDVVCALNFSALGYHDPVSLGRYLRHAWRCLDRRGIVVVDLFGGAGAEAVGTQSVRHDGFTYHWEQRAFDPATRRIDCRIHFTLDDGQKLRDAFRYDWRLWEPAQVLAAMGRAGLSPHLWCDRWDPATGQSDGIYRPLPAGETIEPGRHDWIAYAVGVRC